MSWGMFSWGGWGHSSFFGGGGGLFGRHHGRDDDDCGDRGAHRDHDRDNDHDHQHGHHHWWHGRDDDNQCDDRDDDSDEDQDGSTGEKITIDFTVGEGDEMTVEISETPEGTLYCKIKPTTFEGELPDLDGIFLNLADDSTAEGLNINPDDTGIPVTGTQIDPNEADSLSNGTTISEPFDIAVQFGQVPGDTEGFTQTSSFTLWSDNGPLTLDDLDLSQVVVLTDTDSADPQVLVGSYDAPTDAQETADTQSSCLDDWLALMHIDCDDEDEQDVQEEEPEIELV